MRWREEIARRSEPTRWLKGGCTSWYVNDEGVNTNNWVGPWLEFRRRTARDRPGRLRAGRLTAARSAPQAASPYAASRPEEGCP